MNRDGGKFVIGGGLSGLIHAFYNPEFKVISPNVGGRLSGKNPISNVTFLHADPMTQKLLRDLGIETKTSTVCIKYIKAGRVTSVIQECDKVSTIRRKLGKPDFAPSDLKLSTDDYYIKTLDVDIEDMIRRLSESIGGNLMSGNVIRVTDSTIVTTDTTYEYDRIVSTIPADVFWSLYHKESEPKLALERGSTTYALCDALPEEVDANDSWGMVYVVDESHPYVRISRRRKETKGMYLYEFPGSFTANEVKTMVPKEAAVIRMWVDPRAIVWTDKNNIPPRNVLFSGRFAQWDHSVKIGDVVRQAVFDCDFRSVWNRQMSFARKFYDFNRVGVDQAYRESVTKDLVLHLYPEVAEILDGVNYKMHRERHEVDVDAVRMEIVDVFKYVLNLMLVWGIDAQGLFDLFDKKSTIVEGRYERKARGDKEKAQ